MSDVTVECASCDWTGPHSKTREIRDFWGRCEPGETISHGECPECGALCYEAAAPSVQVPSNAITALRAVKDWHTRAPIAEIEAVEASIGENFPQAAVDAALASIPSAQSPDAMALLRELAVSFEENHARWARGDGYDTEDRACSENIIERVKAFIKATEG